MGFSVCLSYSLNQSTKYISLSSTGCWCCCRYFLDTKSPDTHQSVRIQWRHTVIQHLLPPSLYTIKIGNHEDIHVGGCYDAQLFRRCAGRIVMVSCCCVCPQFFLSALPPRGSINNKHFCNNFQQKQIITLSGIDNVVSCYLSKNHNL